MEVRRLVPKFLGGPKSGQLVPPNLRRGARYLEGPEWLYELDHSEVDVREQNGDKIIRVRDIYCYKPQDDIKGSE